MPNGEINSDGELIIKIVSPNELEAIHETGGFGGSRWKR